jgi:sugar-specific transcriptional regulator TrmB
MSEQTDKIILLLKPFGLSSQESEIYLKLLENNELSALEISRDLHIGRTKVYRILDKLISKQLVIQKLESSGFKFGACDPSQFSLLLSKQEGELEILKKSLPEVLDILKNRIGNKNPGSQIFYYRGKEGLLRVNWNLLNAKGEFLSYEVSNAEAYMPHREAERLRQELVNRKIHTRTLINIKNFKISSDIEGLENFYKIHFIDEKILKIRADIFIYNDIFAICHYLDDGDIFCLEMQNEYLVKMQREIFENLWKQSKI